MHVVRVRNVHHALPTTLNDLRRLGVRRESRNGPVIKFPEPVTTVYERPEERVLFWPQRDANPFFHFFEALWMLAGRNDTKFVAGFVKNMLNFSDDGKTFHGAYGYRWRKAFGMDQLDLIIETLRANPDDRRSVLQIWDADQDLAKQGKDFPCNLTATFQVTEEGAVDMTVFNRSNDIVWGAYGANAVHFAFLQEYVASSLERRVGVYRQVSANLHGYLGTLDPVQHLADEATTAHQQCPYAQGLVQSFPLMQTDRKHWDRDLLMFLEEGPIVGLGDPFFRRVATPLWFAHHAYKENEGEAKFYVPLEILEQCRASDWRKAAEEWITRRYDVYLNKQVEKDQAQWKA